MLETRLVWMPEDIKGFWKEVLKDAPDLTLRDAPSRWCVTLKGTTYPTPVVVLLSGKLVGVTGWRRAGDTLNVLILLRGMAKPIIVPSLLLPAKRLEVLRYLKAIRLALKIENRYNIPFADRLKIVGYRWAKNGFDAEVRLYRETHKDAPLFTTLTLSPTLVFVELLYRTPDGATYFSTLPPDVSDEALEKAIKGMVVEAHLRGAPIIKGV
jgi:hypothetical protein